MSSPASIETRVLDLLDRDDTEGFRTANLEHVDFDAFDDGRYDEVLQALDAGLSKERYSIISMLLAGIYFGLLVGHWLMDLSSWLLVARWAVPVGLVALYAIVTARNIVDRIQRLSKARALVEHLADAVPESTS